MRIIFGSEDLQIENSAVALGDFDAIHKGHIEIISDMLSFAKEKDLLSVVYMFKERPNKNVLGINSLEKRFEILEKMGVDITVVEEFTEEYRNTTCENFVNEYINNRLKAKAVFVGFNYRFGKEAKGDTNTLEDLCKKDGIDVFVKNCVKINGVTVSSSKIRELIADGEVEKTKEFMTREFSVSGTVIKGKQLGRTIGFPTANIQYPEGIIVPKEGVYITLCKIGKDKYYSITNVGGKPTVSDKSKNIETAIGNFNKDIYGEKIEIEFHKRIRDINRFDSLNKLKEQLSRDMNIAKIFSGAEKEESEIIEE